MAESVVWGRNSKFDLVRPIGKGGFSTVYLIAPHYHPRAPQLACKVAPKILKGHDYTSQFRKEADILGLFHGDPHVVQVLDYMEDDENMYIIMEYCAGGTVHRNTYGIILDERHTSTMMRRCLDCIAVCHEKGILHLDVKPDNFMFSKERGGISTIKIGDFGASVYDYETRGSTIGTPHFTAPERLRSQVCAKSDVWSLGVMTHLLLTGRYPFTDSDCPYTPKLQKVFESILNAPIEQDSTHFKRLTPCAKDFMMRMLEKNVDARMGVMEALEHPFLSVYAWGCAPTRR